MEYRPFYLAKEWVKLGHNVTIVAASFSHVRGQMPLVRKTVTHEVLEGVNYLWLKTPPYRGNGFRRVLNMIVFIGRLFGNRNSIYRLGKPDVVIASSTYPLDIFPARFIAKASGAKLIFEVHDLWPMSPVELGGMSPWHPFILVMQWAENYAYRKAEWVVSMLPKADSYMIEHGMAPHKFVYVPNGVVVEEWLSDDAAVPTHHRMIVENLRREGRFLVGYAGGHSLSNALDQLMEAASLLCEYPVTFVLIGQGPEKTALEQKASEMKLDNVVFLPQVPKPAIPGLLAMMDTLYIGWTHKPIYRFGICPNKLIDYMMSAKPVIHAVDAGNDLVAESGCGISVAPQDPKAISDAVIQLMQKNREERAQIGKKGRDYVLAHHDYKMLAGQFIKVLS